MSGIFKAYDIRGTYPGELNETMAKKIGACFVLLLKAGKIVVGRDMRLSASSLAEAFIQGAVSAGASVIDIGMVSTPMLYYAIIEGKYEGGAMVTASHLPGGMNGFKLCREDAVPLSGDHGLPALERLVKEELPAQQHSLKEGSYLKIDFRDKYIDKLIDFVHQPKPLKIVVDAGNGMAGLGIDTHVHGPGRKLSSSHRQSSFAIGHKGFTGFGFKGKSGFRSGL
jgi:phosphomannomutase